MTPQLHLLAYSVFLTFAMIAVSATLRTKIWTPKGLALGAGNRESLPEPTPLMGRADRAAKNMLENMVMFAPLVLIAHVSGTANDSVLLGCQVFVASRLAYFPIYIAGIPWVRTLCWAGGVAGMAMIALQLL
jgi:uncharacterized MAPEG superfamily protein